MAVSREIVAKGIGWIVLLVSAVAPATRADTGAEFFEKRIRPLLAENCYVCHSSAGNVAMGGLRGDSREGLLAGGVRGPAVIPGDPDGSPLIRAVRYQDEQLAMPPTGQLAGAEIAALERWVELGAPWGVVPAGDQTGGVHWSFAAVREPSPPAVRDAVWVRSPIDSFVLAKLEAEGLRPAPEADRRTLIRRVFFDLIGLPPTPEEVAGFLADGTPEAYATVVDRLLSSPRYGERWGRHWLDVARYSDSNGVDENLAYKNAFRYRDYVIDAFNKDKPYDRFVTEQLAGDLMPGADDLETRYERWTATGFLSLGPKMLAEDDPVKMQMDIVDEQLDTAARAFMGLTVGCARCHDHKFDPIPTADYYAMAGIFKSSKTMENYDVVARWHEYVLAPKEDRDFLATHLGKIASKTEAIGKIVKREKERIVREGWRKAGTYLLAADTVLKSQEIDVPPLVADGDRTKAAGSDIIVRDADAFDRGNAARDLQRGDKNVERRSKAPYFAEYEIEVRNAGNYQIDFLDMEHGFGTADLWINGLLMKTGAAPVSNRAASPDPGGWSVSGIYPLEAGGNTIRLEHRSRFPYFRSWAIAPSRLPEGADPPMTPARLARLDGLNLQFLRQWVQRLRRDRGATASILYAWHAFRDGLSLADWRSPAAAHFGGRAFGSSEELADLYQELFDQAVREWSRLHPDDEINYSRQRYRDEAEMPALPEAGLEAFRAFLYEKYGPFRPENIREYYSDAARGAIEGLEQQRKELENVTPEHPRAMGVREGPQIGDIPVHIRGSHWTLGEVVPRGFLSVIAHDSGPKISVRQSGRLHLARWMTSPDHPLTARVMANRLWRWHFGRGIVPTPDNFGRLGRKPSDQPLLDWLALRFIDSGWSVKRMHRLIVLSSTYRMSTEYNARAAAVDPENRLLWRANRSRLEAEAIRDAIVSLSDDMDFSMGGSILDVKDRAYVANTRRRGTVDYDINRRAVYLPVVRSSLYDVFTAFEFADPSVPNGDRGASVVAPQALFMMNASIVLRHTRRMAERLLQREDLDDAGRVRDTYERVLARPPRPEEIDRALTFVANVENALGARAGTAEDRRARAWQSFCKAMVGSNEFLYLN